MKFNKKVVTTGFCGIALLGVIGGTVYESNQKTQKADAQEHSTKVEMSHSLDHSQKRVLKLKKHSNKNASSSSAKKSSVASSNAQSVPSKQQTVANAQQPNNAKVYRANFGDTLSGIAQSNGTTVDALVKANPQISNPNDIYVGQPIVIPNGKASTTQNTYYHTQNNQQSAPHVSFDNNGNAHVQPIHNSGNTGVNTGSHAGNTMGSTVTGNTGVNTGSHAGNTMGSTVTGNTGVNTGSHAGNTTGSTVTGNTGVNTGSHAGNTTGSTVTGNTGVNTGSHAGNTTGSTVTGNTGVNTGSHAGNTTPSVSGSVNTGSHVAGNTSTNTGSTVTPNTQGSASQTGSSATQKNNSQKTPTIDSSSASQQAPAQSGSAQQPASSASHATAPSAGSNTQQPASSASSTSQPTGSSQAQGSVNTGSTTTPSNSQKTPTVDSSSASSNTQQPAQSSSSQSGASSSSQQTTTSSSSSQQPASSASSSASSSSQSSTSSSASSSSQKTVDGYTLDNMPLSVFNDKKNLDAINNTFSGDAIENYFNNHIGKGNMTWDEAQQAQQNGTITSAILSWNGQMLPTEIKGNTYGQAIQNSTTNVNWNNSLPLSYLRNDSQEAQINNKYGNISNETNESQSEGLTQYMLEVINNYRKSQGLSEATTDSALQQKAQERLNTLTSFSHSGMVTDDEALEEMEVTPNNEFDLMNQGYQSIVDMLLDDADSNWGHRNTLLHDKQFACAYKVVNGQGIIVIVANK